MIRVGELIDRSADLVRKQIRLLAPLLLLTIFVGLILDIGRTFLLVPGPLTGRHVVLSFGFLALAALANFFISVAFLRLVDATHAGRTEGSSAALRGAVTVLIPSLLTFLLTAALEILGTALLILPGIVLAVWLGFALPISALRGTPPPASLRESRELSRGRFFPVLWRLFAPLAFWQLAATLIGTLIATIVISIGGALPPAVRLISAHFASGIVQSLALPASLAALLYLYYDLRPGDRP